MTRIPRILQAIKDQVDGMAVEMMLVESHDRDMEKRLGLERRNGRDRRSYKADVRKEAERRIAERRK